jgi:SAM-dependent methyltransferase
MALYDTIGRSYGSTRQADPRIAAAIHAALGDVESVVNVGAGGGSYEPPQTVLGVEPSAVMIAQRPAGAAPVVQAVAEHLPLPDKCVDVAMGVLTVHHWTDVEAGLAELRRVARQRVVLFTWRPETIATFWLLADYLPAVAAVDSAMAVPVDRLAALLPGATVASVPVPRHCTDGFGAAYWGRPEAYLDPVVQAGISMIARSDPATLTDGLDRLRRDLGSGEWDARYGDLRTADSLDVGYCLVTAEL